MAVESLLKERPARCKQEHTLSAETIQTIDNAHKQFNAWAAEAAVASEAFWAEAERNGTAEQLRSNSLNGLLETAAATMNWDSDGEEPQWRD